MSSTKGAAVATGEGAVPEPAGMESGLGVHIVSRPGVQSGMGVHMVPRQGGKLPSIARGMTSLPPEPQPPPYYIVLPSGHIVSPLGYADLPMLGQPAPPLEPGDYNIGNTPIDTTSPPDIHQTTTETVAADLPDPGTISDTSMGALAMNDSGTSDTGTDGLFDFSNGDLAATLERVSQPREGSK
jgi:hypothetical protein